MRQILKSSSRGKGVSVYSSPFANSVKSSLPQLMNHPWDWLENAKCILREVQLQLLTAQQVKEREKGKSIGHKGVDN